MDSPAVHIDANTRLVALLGYPLGQTLSPFIHNTAFAAQGLNFAFAAFPVLPERIGDGVRGLSSLHFAGAGVTIPHKQAVLPYLDELSPRRAPSPMRCLLLFVQSVSRLLRGPLRRQIFWPKT